MMRLLLLFTLLLSPLFAHELKWDESYVKALEKAKAQKKPLLLFFTGSDWSGIGMKMKKEVFDSEGFQKIAKGAFVFVEIDFPKLKVLPKEESVQNEFLKSKFKIEEVPTLLILDEKEREITRLAYLPENGKQLGEDLVRIVMQDKELQAGIANLKVDSEALKKLYSIAQDLQQDEIRDLILAEGVKENNPYFLLEKYRTLIETKKHKEAYLIKEKLLPMHSPQIDFTLALIDFQDLANDPIKKKSPELIIRPLEEYLSNYRDHGLETIWRLEMMIAETYLEADEWQKARAHAEKASAASPCDVKEEIESLITYIEKQQKTNQAIN